MTITLSEVLLRPLEERDLDQLYGYKNDPAIMSLLVGFGAGYSRKGLVEWLERHTGRQDEILWSIAEKTTDRCIGYAGLYNIDGRTRSCTFGILIGDKSFWGRHAGTEATGAVLEYAFRQLNLRRVALTVLAANARARRVYEKIGFEVEGLLKQAEFRDGSYLDIVLMAKMAAA